MIRRSEIAFQFEKININIGGKLKMQSNEEFLQCSNQSWYEWDRAIQPIVGQTSVTRI